MRILVRIAWTLLVAAAGLAAQPRELSLKAAVDLALELSPPIQIANLQALESRGQYGIVRSGYLPQLNGTVDESVQTNNLRGIGLTFPGIPARIGPFQVFDARPRLSQTVFDLSLVKDMAAARRRIRQAEFDAVSLRETVLLTVVDLYLRTLQSQARLDATRARLTTAQALAVQAQDFLEVGTGNRLDLSRARSQAETESATLAQNEQQLETTKLLLLQTIGLSVETEVRLTETLAVDESARPDPEETTAVAVERRPEIRAVRSKLDAARLDVSSARAQRFPTLSFSADYGVIGERISKNLSTYAIRGALNVPVFQGGRIQAEVKTAKSRMQQVEEELRDLENEVRLDVKAAQIQLAAAERAALAAGRAGAAADESVELSRLRFDAGLTSNIDVVQAQQEQSRADELEIQTLYEYYLARANLAKALGDVTIFLRVP